MTVDAKVGVGERVKGVSILGLKVDGFGVYANRRIRIADLKIESLDLKIEI